jgi:iron complex transport system substrate-binding protein
VPLFLALLLGCGREPERPAGPVREVVDARGKTVKVPAPPRRIVSIAPSATEMLFEVGAGAQVAGVTAYCSYPAAARERPKVGSLVLDYESIAALKPDLIVTVTSITREKTAELERKGYAVFGADAGTFEEMARMLRALGEATGHPEEGARAADGLLARVSKVKAEPGPTFYFEHSSDPLGTSGPESYVGDALRRAGGRNVFDGGWRLIDWESVLARDPEVILIAHDQREGLERRAGWSGLRAVKGRRVHFVSKDHYVYPTPRLAEGLEEAHRIFHEKGR